MKEILKTLAAKELDEAIERIKTANKPLNVTDILNWVYGIAGLVAVGFVVYGAISYTTSQGEPGKIKQASQAITYALIGLVIVVMAAVLTNFVLSSLINGGAV